MTTTAEALRHKPLILVLRALATGEVSSQALTTAFLQAIARDAGLNAWTCVDADGAMEAARQSDARRASGAPLGRLDGVPLAIKDNIDVAGLPTTVGLKKRREMRAENDAHIVSRLRGAGAVLLGTTNLDEATLGTVGRNAHYGDVVNPLLPGRVSGGSSAGSAVAVAAGHAVAALGSDTLGSVRIPASFCGIAGFKPSFGELSCRGMQPSLRRLDCPGILARQVQDIAPLLQTMAGYDAADPRSRRRRVALALPDWDPSCLRVGVLADPAALGAEAAVVSVFQNAVRRASGVFGQAGAIQFDIHELDIAATRRAALLMMEADLLAAHHTDLAGASEQVLAMLAFAQKKSASDYARADLRLDRHVVRVRQLFERFDVLILPVTPLLPPATDAPEPATLADFTALASLAGCPALAVPLEQGVGLQLVGLPGSDLRLLELGTVLAAVIEAESVEG